MANTTTKIADLLTRHDINLMRVEAHVRRDVLKLLNSLESDVIDKLKSIDPTAPAHVSFRTKRFDTLMSASKDSYESTYGTINKTMEQQMTDLAEIESVNTVNTVNKVIQVKLATNVLNTTTLKALAGKALIEGAPSSHWWAEQSRGQRKAFERAMREGILAGEPLGRLVQRVRGTRAAQFKNGIFNTTRRQAEALVRSSVQSVANEARHQTYRNNEDVVKGMQWLSTLDSRTSEICQALDGQAWDLEGNRLPETSIDFVRPPPAHWNCRSTLVPILRSWSELSTSTNPKIKKALEKKTPSRRTRSEMDGAKVSSKLRYEDWLKRKDKTNPEMVQGILGPTKYRLWKEGKLAFTDLVDQSWNPLSISELKAKVGLKTPPPPKPKPKPKKVVKPKQITNKAIKKKPVVEPPKPVVPPSVNKANLIQSGEDHMAEDAVKIKEAKKKYNELDSKRKNLRHDMEVSSLKLDHVRSKLIKEIEADKALTEKYSTPSSFFTYYTNHPEYLKAHKEHSAIGRQIDKIREEMDNVESSLLGIASKLRTALLERMSISEARALTNHMTGLDNFPMLRSHLTTFLRITGGKGALVKDFKRTASRAYADELNRMINVGSGTPRVIFHEMGHFVEFENKAFLNSAKEFISSRSTGKRKPLRELVPGSNYDLSEIADPDDFISPYVGKYYRDATEVISMGLEHFVGEGSMAKLMMEDPEHFFFTLGVILR